MGDWANPCGGQRWRELPDGTYEVEGEGVIMPPAGEGQWSYRSYVRNSWRNFEPEMRAAAERRGVPLTWILAITATETGILSGSRTRQATSQNACCWGPMAVMVTPHANYKVGGYTSADDMLDPAKGIDAGTAIMRELMDKGLDLPSISARYNSGGLCCPSSPQVPSGPGKRAWNDFLLCSARIENISYPWMTMMMNNFAILEMGLGGEAPRSLFASSLGKGLLAAGIVVALAGGYFWLSKR